MNNSGLNTLPCLSPIFTSNSCDAPPPTTTLAVVFSYIASTILTSALVVPSTVASPSPSLWVLCQKLSPSRRTPDPYCLPILWRQARVVALLKPGKDPSSPNSFRPISLLCHLYKLYERLTLNRLSPIIEHVLIPEQADFRPGKSCTAQVLNLMHPAHRRWL